MATVTADFQERKRITFTARDRAFTNVRAMAEDGGPIGFTSGELLLIALGNCSLGTLLNHEMLKNVPVKSCRAVLESESERNPSWTGSIKVTIELEVETDALEGRRETLERVAGNCPVGNTLRFSPQIDIELRLTTPKGVQEPARA